MQNYSKIISLFLSHGLMVCLHWKITRPKPIKNVLFRIVWRTSNCTETDTNTDCHWVLYSCYQSLSWLRPVGIHHNSHCPIPNSTPEKITVDVNWFGLDADNGFCTLHHRSRSHPIDIHCSLHGVRVKDRTV